MLFSKYYANGNDFVIAEFDNHNYDFSQIAQKVCNRYKGIGADGLIGIIKEENKDYDFSWAFYNQDGSSASMCGNGARAAAHFAYTNKLAKNDMKFLTGAGIINASIFDDDFVEIKLSCAEVINLDIKESDLNFALINTGVPHLLTFDGVDKYNEELAKYLRKKYDANVNYASLKDGVIYVRTYERGVGETLACGTGMSACFYYAYIHNLVPNEVLVYPKSNEKCYLKLAKEDIYFKAEVKKIFQARFEI